MDASDLTPHLERFSDYETACSEFKPSVPEYFNVASAILGRHPDAITRQALLEVKDDGVNTYTFGGLDYLSDKFASLVVENGFREGNVVATILKPSAALAVTQLGTLKAGGAVLTTPEDLSLAVDVLAQSSARILVCDESFIEKAGEVQKSLPALHKILIARDLRPVGKQLTLRDFWSDVDQASSDFSAVMTRAASPAFLFYEPREDRIVRIAHRHASIVQQLAAFEMLSDLEADCNAVWLTEDWHTVESLLSIIYPAWWYGASILTSCSNDFASQAEDDYATHAFISSQGSSMIWRVLANRLPLPVTGSPAMHGSERWLNLFEKTLSLFATPETGVVAVTCPSWFPRTAGSCGRAVPGFEIKIQDESGVVVPAGTRGEIVLRSEIGVDSQIGFALEGSQPENELRARIFGFMNMQKDLFVETSRE